MSWCNQIVAHLSRQTSVHLEQNDSQQVNCLKAEYLGFRMGYAGRYSLLKTLQTSASSWRPSWSLSRVSRDCWIYLRMRRRNIFSGALVLDQPAPLKIIHQLHKGNPIQLDALKALIEPAIKPKNWVFVVESIHYLYFVRMWRCSSLSLASRSASASSFSTRASTASAV